MEKVKYIQKAGIMCYYACAIHKTLCAWVKYMTQEKSERKNTHTNRHQIHYTHTNKHTLDMLNQQMSVKLSMIIRLFLITDRNRFNQFKNPINST